MQYIWNAKSFFSSQIQLFTIIENAKRTMFEILLNTEEIMNKDDPQNYLTIVCPTHSIRPLKAFFIVRHKVSVFFVICEILRNVN